MVRRWTAGTVSTCCGPEGVKLRELTADDEDALGHLLWEGFGADGFDGFASASAADEEARATLAGKWGPMIWDASVLALRDDTAVAASVVLKDDAHQLSPLLAFLVTDPEHRRQGIAESLILETIRRIEALQERELHLAVTPENPARALYLRLGFAEESR